MSDAPIDRRFRTAAGRRQVQGAYRRIIDTHLPTLQQHTVRTRW